MAYTQAYTAYKETGVKTASQSKLIIMLYEEILKQLDGALLWYGTNDKIEPAFIEKFHNNLLKAREIITELMVSLDMEKGGEIAVNLMALYSFFNRELMEISLSHDRRKLSLIQGLINELYASWTIAANTATIIEPTARKTIDING